MRDNLLARLRAGGPLLPGVIGYEETVLRQLAHAILSSHDLLLLGLRGQGKTRILRQLVDFLDERMPVVAGSEINDDPFAPVSRYARELIAERGDETPIEWIGRERRYGEKLATPDVSMADLIGDIDPVKALSPEARLRARGRHPVRDHPAHQPRHLRHQRIAGPAGPHPGGPAQHHGGAGHPDPQLPRAHARWT